MKLASIEGEKKCKHDPLGDFYTIWDDIESEDVYALQEAIDSAKREEDVQKYIKENPKCLIQHLGGGHGRWVLPKKSFGGDHVTDFMIAEKHSMGFEWQAVELESPLKRMFNKNGDPSSGLTHAIRQIQDWRVWLTKNQNYAARRRDKSGLGLTDIDGSVQGLILIGRRANEYESFSDRRRQMVKDLSIRIHTFDYLLEAMDGRLRGLSVFGMESET